MLKNAKLHAPPILELRLGPQPGFRGVLQSLDVTYLLFHTDGTPLRAKLASSSRSTAPVESAS